MPCPPLNHQPEQARKMSMVLMESSAWDSLSVVPSVCSALCVLFLKKIDYNLQSTSIVRICIHFKCSSISLSGSRFINSLPTIGNKRIFFRFDPGRVKDVL